MRYDAVVIGAGFGGLAAALTLAEGGARVLLCESLTYPGGCAATFRRGGHDYEAGATLFAGFGEGQLFRRWIARHRLPVEFEPSDPVVECRSPGLSLPVPADRERFLAALSAMPGAPGSELRRFFARQGEVARLLWSILDDPALLPPFGPGALRRHLARAPRYLALALLAGRPLRSLLGPLERFEPLRIFLEGICRITLQCGIDEAEAPFALAAADYFFRGVGHVRGGIGRLAAALVGAIRSLGGEVLFASRVRTLRCDGVWRVGTNRGEFEAGSVVANVLPHDLEALLGAEERALRRPKRLVESGWGACMLYLRTGEPSAARHIQIVQEPGAPFLEGNHLFVSAAEASATVSTHVRVGAGPAEIAATQARMLEGVRRFAPELRVESAMTASPRTFRRFTGRHRGFVGGIPRRAGWGNYRALGPLRVRRGLWLAGDTVFPGQSTLAAAIGGRKAAEAVLRAGSA